MQLSHLHSLISASLCTLILLVQFLIYPSFHNIAEDSFRNAMEAHQRKISFIVIPLMVSELLLSAYFAFSTRSVASIASFLLVLLVWASTAFIQVPLHQKLLMGKNHQLIKQLVQSNYVRVILWISKFSIMELFHH